MMIYVIVLMLVFCGVSGFVIMEVFYLLNELFENIINVVVYGFFENIINVVFFYDFFLVN